MTDPNVEPLTPELSELLAVERDRPPPPDYVKARVLAGVTTAVTLPDPGPVAGGGGGASGAAVVKGLALFVAGGLTGATVATMLGDGGPPALAPQEAPAVVAPVQPVEEPPVVAPKPAPDTPPPSRAQAAKRAQPAKRPAEPVGRDLDLAAERALVERARTALARRQPEQALAALSEHQRRHPGGKLTEEREALAVQALVSAGRYPAARTRAAAFHETYPRSMLAPVVDAALAAIPPSP